MAIIDGTTDDDEPLVVWGQRNRISEPSLEDRTVFAVNRVYPELNDVRAELRTLPSPVLMTPNQSWLENLSISPNDANLQNNDKANTRKNVRKFSPEQLEILLLQDSRHIHDGKPTLAQ